jgi:hypothetical protein
VSLAITPGEEAMVLSASHGTAADLHVHQHRRGTEEIPLHPKRDYRRYDGP